MKKTIIAQTFTPTYDILEDRIRLAINYEDYNNRIDLMITRRFALELIPALEEWIIVKEQEAQSFVEKGEPKAVSKTNGANLELMRREAVLLEEVNLKKDANNNITLTLRSQETTVVAVLEAIMFQEFCRVLKASVPHIDWGIGFSF